MKYILLLGLLLTACQISESVCGKVEVQCITTPCDPVEETFSSRAEAEERGAFDIKEGRCTEDDIQLMEHDGNFGCFGCSQIDNGAAICIDPTAEMKPVEETEKRYCKGFDVIECTVHEDCETPMEYQIRSNCQFTSACIDSQCKVICPLFTTCGDCDCSDRGELSLDCVCLDGSCVSVEGR